MNPPREPDPARRAIEQLVREYGLYEITDALSEVLRSTALRAKPRSDRERYLMDAANHLDLAVQYLSMVANKEDTPKGSPVHS